MIEIILISIGLLGLIAATITDLKTREVPDALNYSMIALGLALWTAKSIIEWDMSYIINSVISFGVLFLLATFMFYTGQWGGGDSKLLMALGALFPTYPIILYSFFNPKLGFPFMDKELPFLFIFIINLIIIGAIYGLLWSIVKGLRNRKEFMKKLRIFFEKKTIKTIRAIILLITTITSVTMLFLHTEKVFLIGLFVLLLCSTFYIWIFVKIVEEISMYKKVNPKELTEGDWIAEDIIINKKTIASPKDLGVSKKQIAILIKLKEQGKINKILIKNGIPFVPSFLIAFIVTLIYGNIMVLLI